MKRTKSGFLICALFSTTLLTSTLLLIANSQNKSVKAENEIKLAYQLDFSDTANLGKNSANNSIASATVVNNGNLTVLENEVKGKNAVYITSSGVRQNFIELPKEVLNNEAITVTGWFKVDSNVPSWARMLEISNGKNGQDSYSNMGVMPFASNYHNGLHINTIINNQTIWGAETRDNMLFEASIPNIERNTPMAGYILPLYDSWVHYAYTLDGNSFKYYQNGKLMKELKGNFAASQFYSDSARITLGATRHDNTVDFTGGYSDIRVYANSLTEEQIISEYDLKYSDFLTTSYNFENGVEDPVRHHNGKLVGNARVAYDETRKSNVLVLDGTNAGSVNETKTSFELPVKSMQGHNELTVSLDVFVDSACSSYARIFEFSPEGRQALSLGAKWGSATSMLLKYTTQNDVTDQKIATDTEFNRWINLTVTLDGTKACIYVDGKLIGKNDNFIYKNSLFWEGIGCFAFGRTQFWNDNPLMGSMDNIKIYSKALTSNEVMLENGLISIIDDNQAVSQEKEKFELAWDGTSATIQLPEYLNEGVKVAYSSNNKNVITDDGIVIFPKEPTIVKITATLSRNEVSMTKEFEFVVQPNEIINPSIIYQTALQDVSFVNDSYYKGLMKTNLDYMMSLDKDRLLYNYRRIAGLSTQGAQSYGAWISPESNGAGQFEAHYVVALAKASVTMPDYRSSTGESVLDRLTYMVKELQKCQQAYAAKDPTNKGYLGGFSTENFDALEEGRNILSDGTSVWVPWYFNHKTLEALLDVHTYAASEELRVIAKEMLFDLADWSYNRMSSISADTRAKVLQREYGGMGEVLFQIYGISKDVRYYTAAKYFEETTFLQNTYKNVDLLTGLHANTTIPKFLAAAAAYEVTNDEFYKTVCINGFEMIMKRTYANGSTSIDEFWRQENVTDTGNGTAETCCSYNMIKLSDYLYRWTNDVKYADYIENVYTNHILASMAPDTGLKTYLTNTAFGYYKVFHTPDTAFWCCACTGMESFAKLPNGIYYVKDNNVTANMYYPSTIKVDNNVTITQTKDLQAAQEAEFVFSGSKELTLSLRKPSWANVVEVYYNNQKLDIQAEKGYYNITKTFKDGDKVVIKTPFEYRLVNLKGHENSYAIMYGPTLYVCDLGNENVQDQQPSQLNFGVAYTGNIVDKIVLENNDLAANATVSVDENNQITMLVKTLNQGTLTFRPFNQTFHTRYGMYFKYYDSLEELDKDYTVHGNEFNAAFDKLSDVQAEFDIFGNISKNVKVENEALITPAEGEVKLIAKQVLTEEYVVEARLNSLIANGQINGGVYVLANAAKDAQDGIKAYNVHVEKDAGANTYRLSVFKFNNGFNGSVASTTLPYDGNDISLHIFVKEDKILVFTGTNRNVALEVMIDKTFITENSTYVGLRSQVCSQVFKEFTIISNEITVGTGKLSNAIANAESLDLSKYTEETKKALQEALAHAKEVISAQTLNQKDVNEADENLRSAIANLVETGDATSLNALLTFAETLDESMYTQASFASLKTVIDQINETDLTKLNQTQINELKASLLSKIEGLVAQDIEVESNLTVLNAMISHLETIDTTKYTEESVQALQAILASAKQLTVQSTQTEIDEVCVELLEAQLALVEKEVEVTPTPDTPKKGCKGTSSMAVVSLIALLGALTLKRRK